MIALAHLRCSHTALDMVPCMGALIRSHPKQRVYSRPLIISRVPIYSSITTILGTHVEVLPRNLPPPPLIHTVNQSQMKSGSHTRRFAPAANIIYR